MKGSLESDRSDARSDYIDDFTFDFSSDFENRVIRDDPKALGFSWDHTENRALLATPCISINE